MLTTHQQHLAAAADSSNNNIIHPHHIKRPNQLDTDTGKQQHRRHFVGESAAAAAQAQATAGQAATGTPKPPTTTLNDVFISVKTTKRNHDSRLDLVLSTWHQLARHQVSYALHKSAHAWVYYVCMGDYVGYLAARR